MSRPHQQAHHTAHRRAGRRRGGERGSMTVELMFSLPVLVALLFVGVQAGLIYHARSVTIAAANAGAFAAAAEHGTHTDGAQAATGFLEQVGHDALTSWDVDAHRDADIARVRVTGTALSIVPGINPHVAGEATVPAEELSTLQGTP